MNNTNKYRAIVLSSCLITSAAYAANDNSMRAEREMNCDSTCIVPNGSMNAQIPKSNTVYATPGFGAAHPKPICGSSAGSLLPSAPNSFLCSTGTPSIVSTTTLDGETTYAWSCNNNQGTQACMATKREIGACGTSHGLTLSTNPSNLCSSGQGFNFNFASNQYTWGCKGNYGSPAMCSAGYSPPTPPLCNIGLSNVTDLNLGGFAEAYKPHFSTKLNVPENYLSISMHTFTAGQTIVSVSVRKDNTWWDSNKSRFPAACQ
jgi:hypothetical protein